MLILIISRTSSSMGGVGLKSRSLGQIFVKSCYHSRSQNFDPMFIKLAQNANIDNREVSISNGYGYTHAYTFFVKIGLDFKRVRVRVLVSFSPLSAPYP